MPTYRFYGNTDAGHRTVGHDFDCSNERTALELATSMLHGYVTIEVWLDEALIDTVLVPPRFGRN